MRVFLKRRNVSALFALIPENNHTVKSYVTDYQEQLELYAKNRAALVEELENQRSNFRFKLLLLKDLRNQMAHRALYHRSDILLYAEEPVFAEVTPGSPEQKAKYGCELYPSGGIETISRMTFIEFFQYGANQRRPGIVDRENQEGQRMNLIRNEREYAHTKQQIEDFDRALTELETAMRKGGSREEKAHTKMQHSAHLRLIGSLRQQIEEYDALRNGTKTVFHCGRMEDLPRALIKAIIAQANIATRINQPKKTAEVVEGISK